MSYKPEEHPEQLLIATWWPVGWDDGKPAILSIEQTDENEVCFHFRTGQGMFYLDLKEFKKALRNL